MNFSRLFGPQGSKHSGYSIQSNKNNPKALSEIPCFGLYTDWLGDSTSGSSPVPTWFSHRFWVLRALKTVDAAYKAIRTTAKH
jgi:hypothetical protein